MLECTQNTANYPNLSDYAPISTEEVYSGQTLSSCQPMIICHKIHNKPQINKVTLMNCYVDIKLIIN